MTVIKRDRNATNADLITALDKLIILLKDQNEDEAVVVLKECLNDLSKGPAGSLGQKQTAEKIVEAFNGDLELISYTIQRESKSDAWTEVEELSQASSRVLSLARRILKG